MPEFGRIVEAIELFVAAQIHRENPFAKLEPATDDETTAEDYERVAAHGCPICRRVEKLHELDDAVGFLERILGDGPRGLAEVLSEALEQGLSGQMIFRAAEKIGVVKRLERNGEKQGWIWEL
jgi:hypothetical protein